MYTLASKFGANVHISLKVWSLGLMYTLASNLGAKVYIILLYTLATTYVLLTTLRTQNFRPKYLVIFELVLLTPSSSMNLYKKKKDVIYLKAIEIFRIFFCPTTRWWHLSLPIEKSLLGLFARVEMNSRDTIWD